MTEMTDNIVHLDHLKFAWPGADTLVLDIPEFAMGRAERVFLKGPSGSGKTTLLSIIAAVLSPQSGSVVVDGVSLGDLRSGQKDQFRVDRIGLVFQQFNLLPFLSVRDNITLPCQFSKRRRAVALNAGRSLDDEVDRLLSAMHLKPSEVQHKRVTDLSVGQQQRVAVARALIGRPALVIADEPTSALDSDTRQAFIDLLFAEVNAAGSALLFVSHDASLAGVFDRCMDLSDINEAATSSSLQGDWL